MSKTEKADVVAALDPIVGLAVVSDDGCAVCGSREGTLRTSTPRGALWLVCECGWHRRQLKRADVFAIIRERRSMQQARQEMKRAL